MSYALRLLVGYVGGAVFFVGLVHLIGDVGASWHALALLAAGAAAAIAGIAGARAVLRDVDRRSMPSRYRQRPPMRPPMSDHSLGRRVG